MPYARPSPHRLGLLWGAAIALALLGGCGPASSAPDGGDSRSSAPEAQHLPVSACAQFAGTDASVALEVARTSQQQAQGLQHRRELAPNRGMLFPFEAPRQVQFWMKDVPIALDMVFVRSGRIQHIAARAPPCPSEPCPTYSPEDPVTQVIELRGGRAQELGLAVGDRVRIESVSPRAP